MGFWGWLCIGLDVGVGVGLGVDVGIGEDDVTLATLTGAFVRVQAVANRTNRTKRGDLFMRSPFGLN